MVTIPYLKTIMAIVILALGLGLWFAVERNGSLSARAEIAEKALSAAQEQRKLDARLLAARQATIASERRKSAQARQALSEALQAAPEWAGTSVPTEVQRALGEAL